MNFPITLAEKHPPFNKYKAYVKKQAGSQHITTYYIIFNIMSTKQHPVMIGYILKKLPSFPLSINSTQKYRSSTAQDQDINPSDKT